MAAYGALNFIFNPIFNPMLVLHPIIVILVIAIIINIVITIVYKYTTNQRVMKDLKDEMKKMQKKLKELRSNPTEMAAYQKQVMAKNMEYMKHSMKSTLYTFIPIIIIYGWLATHVAFYPIMPMEPFSVTLGFAEGINGNVTMNPGELMLANGSLAQEIIDGRVSWLLKGGEGLHLIEFKHGDQIYEKKVLITTEQAYEEPNEVIKDKSSDLKTITISNRKLKPMGKFRIGSYYPGWFMTYLILSIVLSFIIRKLFKVY